MSGHVFHIFYCRANVRLVLVSGIVLSCSFCSCVLFAFLTPEHSFVATEVLRSSKREMSVATRGEWLLYIIKRVEGTSSTHLFILKNSHILGVQSSFSYSLGCMS